MSPLSTLVPEVTKVRMLVLNYKSRSLQDGLHRRGVKYTTSGEIVAEAILRLGPIEEAETGWSTTGDAGFG